MKKSDLQHNDSMFKGASAQIFANAKKLRSNITNAEKVLWEELRHNKFHGLKFRRQHPIQNFIADFYCHKHKLVIEIDGDYHLSQNQIEYDKNREEILNFNDIIVMRFTNDKVLNDLDKVLLL
jgi:very-short-patch-repair endonuclease